MTALYQVPSALVLGLAITLAVALACAGQAYVHRRFKSADFIAQTEVAGYIIGVLGALYGVVLGFFTVVVWQQYDIAAHRVSLETDAASDAWHAAVGLRPDVRTHVRQKMEQYGRVMLTMDWPAMQQGRFAPEADVIVMDSIGSVGEMIPWNLAASNAQAETLRQLMALHDQRHERLSSNEGALSWFAWTVLFIGAAAVIAFCWLFGVPNPRTHLLMTASVAVIISSMFVLIFELEHPFRGDLGIRPAAWKGFLDHVRFMDSQGMPNMRM